MRGEMPLVIWGHWNSVVVREQRVISGHWNSVVVREQRGSSWRKSHGVPEL